MGRRHFVWLLILLALGTSIPVRTVGKVLKLEVDLRGEWRLEIGDDPRYKDPNFDDSTWERIAVPSTWENEGFPGYDGYAWYRTRFVVPAELKGKRLYLRLGRVDDVDQVFLNGKYLGGKGSFPPRFKTAWDDRRTYKIPPGMLHFGGENVLAVRVYDAGGAGGIVDGPVGIFSRLDVLKLALNLKGPWKFRTGDKPEWKRPGLDDSQWPTIEVPSCWEKQGYRDYDGVAWYRKHVVIPDTLARHKLILMLGKINDIDEAYFNGTEIGHTGRFPQGEEPAHYKDKKKVERAYFIPPFLIRPGKDNVIAVRVLDVGKYGGIYEGYIGLATRGEYLKYIRRKRKCKKGS